jgi:hypothetical protein
MSTTNIQATIRQLVIDRAEGRCEYCRSPQLFSSYRYEIDHITAACATIRYKICDISICFQDLAVPIGHANCCIAEKHGGDTVPENLALACLPCNRYKGSDIASLDPVTGELTRLFNPRMLDWWGNFGVEDGFIVGKTPVGRTTVFLLKFNTAAEVALRQMLMAQGLFV